MRSCAESRVSGLGYPVFACVVLAISAAAPARTLVVDQAHPKAADDNIGTPDAPFRTINAAAQVAQPGDTVLVHAGVYRERVAPARGGEEGRPVAYQAAPGETVYVKGSEVWKPVWKPVDGSPELREGKFDGVQFGRFNPYAAQLDKQPKGMTQGQLFVDGRPLRQVTGKAEAATFPGSWTVNESRDGLYVHFQPSTRKPEDRLVELTVRGRIFAPTKRNLGFITVRRFVFEHCANNFPTGFYAGGVPQAGAVGTRGGHHWIIEDNVIRHAQAIGLDIGAEGGRDYDGLNQPQPKYVGFHVVRNNVISDNGNCGIAGYRALRTQIVGNVIERNNRLGFGGAENGGMKAHFFIGGLIEGNLFRDNETYGLWLDNVWQGTRVTRNVFVGNRDAGIFMEMGGDGPGKAAGPAGVLIDNNVIAFTRGTHNGAGIYAHDAGGMTIVHNLIVGNALYGVYIRVVTGRKYAVFPEDIRTWETPAVESRPCRPVNIRIMNNLILGNGRGPINMPYPGPTAQGNVSDHNLFNSGGMMSWMFLTPFVANTNGGTDMKGILAAWDKAVQEANLPPEKRMPPIEYHKGPLLDLWQWQLLTKFDTHSLVPRRVGGDVNVHDLVANVTVDDAAWQIACPVILGVDKDFLGNPMPKDKPLPGPFQNLRKGDNRLILWPVVGGGAASGEAGERDTIGVEVD